MNICLLQIVVIFSIKKKNTIVFQTLIKEEKIKIKKEELNLLKAIKQNYNNRMINNKMTNEN